MQLTLLLTISILAAHLNRISFFKFFQSWALKLHSHCLESLPKQSQALAELKALVCGADFTQAENSTLYVATGLVHLFVVSGAHLILIKKFIDIFTNYFELKQIENWLCLVVLIYFSASCAFNAPVTRALFSLILADDFILKKKHWPADFRIFTVGLVTLLFNLNWLSSISLQLSWLIALGLLLNRTFFLDSHRLMKQFLILSLIYPTLIFLQVPEPLVALINLVFSTFLELILFPFALLVRFFNFLFPAFDLLILLLKNILAKTEISFQFQLSEQPTYLIIFNWSLIFMIHIILHLIKVQKERRKLCFATE